MTDYATESSMAAQLAEDYGQNAMKELETPKEGFPESGPQAPHEVQVVRYSFDAGFQTKIAALVLRDPTFNEKTDGLIRPEYFETVGEAALVRIGLEYFRKFRRCADVYALAEVIKQAISEKMIPERFKPEIKTCLVKLLKADVGDRDFVVEQTTKFAKHRAMENAILKSAEMLDTGNIEGIETEIKKALQVGSIDSATYDFYAELGSRTESRRIETLYGAGGIPTGVPAMDAVLYHKGWGRKELSVYMGGAKAGKSTALLCSQLAASLAGHNVLGITLEMGLPIAAMRLDANLANMSPQDMRMNPEKAKLAIEAVLMSKKRGQLVLHEFPSGTFSPNDLRRLINHYKALGINFDLIVVDYLDIMRPNRRYDDEIANSKSVWVDTRAIAQEENVAILSATQTNRDGYKASVAKAEHVAEDFNKIRTADVVISINRTEEEEKKGFARLFFAASRNQQGGISILVKQDLTKMKFVTQVISVE